MLQALSSRNRRPYFFIVALFMLMAYRGEAQDFDGDWSSSSGSRTFTVVNDRIVEFSFRATISIPFCSTTVTLSGTASVPIVDNSFSFAPAAGNTSFLISGTFRSFTSVGGSLVIIGTNCSVISFTSWSATKVGDDTISVLIGDGQVVEGDFGFTAGELEVTLDSASTTGTYAASFEFVYDLCNSEGGECPAELNDQRQGRTVTIQPI